MSNYRGLEMIRCFLAVFVVSLGICPPLEAQTPRDDVSGSVTQAAPIWKRGIERIHSLYLERGALSSTAIFDGVVEQLEGDIPWLMVQADGDLYRFSYGATREIGTLSVGQEEDIENSLLALVRLISGAGEALPDELDLEISVMKGVARALDRHSKLLHGEKLTSFDKRLRGTLSGIGTLMKIIDGRLTIVEVYEKTPANRAGLMAKDRILRVDDVSTLGMSLNEASSRITGERGTEVSLLVERQEGSVSVELEMTLVRAEIKIPNVSGRSLSSGIGYVRIEHFSERTVDNMRRVLRGLERDGGIERGLVIDLRGNTGGSMIQSARVADLFLSDGELVRTEGPDGKKVRGLVHRLVALPEARDFDIPLVVLQNKRTASGAEILAGALQESGRALLVGARSYGKGSVQKVYTLRKDARFKLTVARYLVGGYREISDIGLYPDVPIGRLSLQENGLNYESEFLDTVEGLQPLFYVERAAGWVDGLEPEVREDYALDFAHAVLEKSPSNRFQDLLASASLLVEGLRKEEEERLVAQMQLKGLDWSLAESTEEKLHVDVSMGWKSTDTVQSGQTRDVELVVWNRGKEDLGRVVAVLSSADRVFDGRRIPLGWIDSGQELRVKQSIDVPASRTGRDSVVEIFIEDDQGRRVLAGEQVLAYRGEGPPSVALDLELLGSPQDATAKIQVTNHSKEALRGLRVRFMHPESAGVELLEYEARIGRVLPAAVGEGQLKLLYDEEAAFLPLRVLVEVEDFGRIAEWDLVMDTDATKVHLDAPRIEPKILPTRVPAGQALLNFRIFDDEKISSVTGYVGGEKYVYVPGSEKEMELTLDVLLDEGPNSVALRAVDEQGLQTTRYWIIYGESTSSTSDVDSTP